MSNGKHTCLKLYRCQTMARKLVLLIIILMVSHAFSESCVSHTFESDIDEFFMQPWFCEDMEHETWKVGTYDNINLSGQDERSSTFITPSDTFTCASTMKFPMTNGGRVEVRIYMDSVANTDQITVLANEFVEGGVHSTVGSAGNSPLADNYVNGWHTLVADVGSSGTSLCYVSCLLCFLQHHFH
ncbi:hypothetical protein B5X24_HaOG206342 [Helicoverpa armigera]|nr:hypothetical protein B5X24_HaOG206342 [Helicoverpa armigera]